MSRYPRTDLSPVLKLHTLKEAHADLAEYDEDLGIIPGIHQAQLWGVIDDLCETAKANAFNTLDQVVENAHWLIARTAGVVTDMLEKPHPFADANRVHLHRNILLALVLAGVASYNGDARGIAKRFPTLYTRSALMQRMHTDDEELLLRVWALHMAQGGDANARRTSAIFAQMDNGVAAGETTGVRVNGIVFVDRQAMIDAPGHRSAADRTIVMDRYNTRVMECFMEKADLTSRSRLTYWPRTSSEDNAYSRGCASAMMAINRMREAVGLNHGDTTCASIIDWRAQITFETQGYDAALALSGRTSEALDGRLIQRVDVFGTEQTVQVPSKDNTLDF